MPRESDFLRHMNEQLLERFEEHARQPGRTGPECLEWLTANGVKTSESAVYRWLQDFKLEYRHGRARDMARAYLAAAKESDPAALTEAAQTKLEELLLEHVMNAGSEDALKLMRAARAMKTGIGTRREVVALRNEIAEAKRVANAELDKLASVATKRALTPEDIAAARQAMYGTGAAR